MVNGMTSKDTLHYLDKRSIMKRVIAICSVLLIGCYNQTPAKIIKNPSMWGVPIIVDTQWDGKYPVRQWELPVKFGEEFVDIQNRVWWIEENPQDSNSVIIKVDVLK